MAISPENTRRAVQGYSIPSYLGPRPDAPIEGGHLAMIAWLYSGITYATGAPAPSAGAGGLLPIWTRRRRG